MKKMSTATKARWLLFSTCLFTITTTAATYKSLRFHGTYGTFKVYKLNASETSCTFLKSYGPSIQGQPTLTITRATLTNQIPALNECTNTVRVRAEGL